MTGKVVGIACGLSLVLIGIAVFYYFVILSPNEYKNNQIQYARQTEMSNDIECQKQGQEYYSNLQNEIGSNAFYNTPTMHYNNTLHKCLIKYQVDSAPFYSSHIDDVYSETNILISTYAANNPGASSGVAYPAFQRQALTLMNQ